MKLKLLIFSLIHLACTTKLFAQYSWNPRANFAGGIREGASGFSIGTKGYFFGGNDPSGIYNDLWEFDPSTNSWSQKSNLPGSVRKNAIAFSIGSKAYVGSGLASGNSYLTDFWEYDPATNNWTQKASIPGPPTYGGVGFAIGSKGYFGTGNTGSGAGPYRDDFYEYDPALNTWTQKANFPGGTRYGAFGLGISNKGYLGFGLYDGPGGQTIYGDWWEFDPANNTWTSKTNYPASARTYLGGFVINNKPFVGTGASTVFYNDFYSFDPTANSWSPIANFPGASRYLTAYFSIGNIGYVGEGYNFSGNYNDFYEYAPTGVAPTVNIQSSDTSWCNNNCIDFFDLSANNPTSWQWYFPGAAIDTSTLQNPVGICYNISGSYDVTLIACNNFGCDSITFTNFINVYPTPISNYTFQTNPCDTSKTASFFNQSLYGTSYIWNFGDGSSDTIASPIHQYAAAGTYPVSLIVINNCGNDTIIQTINIFSHNTAQAAFSFSSQPCSLQVSFTNSSQNATGLIWNFGDGTIDTISTNPVHTYANPGNYVVTLIAKDSCGNDTSQITINLSSIQPPISNYTFQTNPCDTSKTASFFNQSLYGTNYIWNFGDGDSDTIANPTHQYSAAGTYSVSLIVINNCGSDTIFQTVNIVSHNNVQAAFSFSSQPCSLQVSFTDSSLNATGLIWDFGDGTIDSLNSNPVHTYTIAGIYIVTLIAKDSCGNDSTQITVDLTSAAQPVSNFTFLTNPCDTNLIVTFSNQSLNALSYVWNFGDGNTDTLASPSHKYTSVGTYIVTLICYNVCGRDTLQLNVQVDSVKNKVAQFDYKITECTGEVVLQNQSLNGTNFSWNFGDGNTSTLHSPIHTYSTPGNFVIQLIVDANSSCPDSISQTLKIENINADTLFIPNCFTPNDDGLNDYFEISGYNDCNTYQLKIFNRWGQLIFQTDDLKNKWNGKFENADVPDGVYVYIVKSNLSQMTGSINVLR